MIIVYTAITNNHDDLKTQPVFDRKAPINYLAYLDPDTMCRSTEVQQHWRCLPSYNNFKEPKRNCQIQKVLSHLYTWDADYSVWIDGSVVLKCSVLDLIASLGDADIALMQHSERICLYEEQKDCALFKLDNIRLMENQMEWYEEHGFPHNFGLSETPVIIRRHTKKVEQFNNYWWAILCAHSNRDQLSFDYVRWKLDMNINYLQGNIHNNPYFEIKKHKVLREHEKL